MAVRAEQDALARLGPRAVKRSRNPFATEMEALGRRVEVVELKNADAVRVPTRRASAAGLGDEDLLDPPTARADGLDDALRKR